MYANRYVIVWWYVRTYVPSYSRMGLKIHFCLMYGAVFASCTSLCGFPIWFVYWRPKIAPRHNRITPKWFNTTLRPLKTPQEHCKSQFGRISAWYWVDASMISVCMNVRIHVCIYVCNRLQGMYACMFHLKAEWAWRLMSSNVWCCFASCTSHSGFPRWFVHRFRRCVSQVAFLHDF